MEERREGTKEKMLVKAVETDPKGLYYATSNLFEGPWYFNDCAEGNEMVEDEIVEVFNRKMLLPARTCLTWIFLLKYMLEEDNRVWSLKVVDDITDYIHEQLNMSSVEVAIMESISGTTLFSMSGRNDKGTLYATIFPEEETAIIRGGNENENGITLVLKR